MPPAGATGAVVLLGVPYDGTASFRPGTRFGPDAIRAASPALETYSPALDRDLEDVPLWDAGNVAVDDATPEAVSALVRAAVAHVLSAGHRLLLLGGEHSITAPAVEAAVRTVGDLRVVQLDAHADLREAYLGSRLSHASAMRRCLDHVPSDRLLQVGIRSGTRAEWQELRESGRLVPPDPRVLEQALGPAVVPPIYLTVDLDVFDPAVLPGTGCPEPGGIDWSRFEAILDAVPIGALVAADVVELSPPQDPSGISAILAAKAVRELALRLVDPPVLRHAPSPAEAEPSEGGGSV